ncbi:YhfC family intramembrane metalloprotease [Bacillus sp. CGMCC 1.60114]|uniref:YhfC family intramembrane metalloprotease n=1 Tax=unclassified Bacillus (in: firmicutes) TaxID=185979 RepID=UPI00362A8403
MVSNAAIGSMIVQIALSVLIPIIVLVYCRKKYRISFKIVGVGLVFFIGFSQILEKTLHVFVFGNPTTAELLKNPFVYAIYGGLTAGIFEELARFIAFFYLLKKYQEYKDGLAYGIGHGGIESLLIGATVGLQSLMFALSINNGTFAKMIEKIPQLSAVQDALLHNPPYFYLFGAVERLVAFIMQIALTMLVLYAVKYKKYIFIGLAVFLHAFIDFFAALYQRGLIHLFVIEGLMVLFGIGAYILIRKMKTKFLAEHAS